MPERHWCKSTARPNEWIRSFGRGLKRSETLWNKIQCNLSSERATDAINQCCKLAFNQITNIRIRLSAWRKNCATGLSLGALPQSLLCEPFRFRIVENQNRWFRNFIVMNTSFVDYIISGWKPERAKPRASPLVKEGLICNQSRLKALYLPVPKLTHNQFNPSGIAV